MPATKWKPDELEQKKQLYLDLVVSIAQKIKNEFTMPFVDRQ